MIKENIRKSYWLEEFESCFIEGADSKRFLNGITTTNINIEKNIIQTCWLTPKGILRALLEIHSYNEKLLLVVLEGNISEIKSFLEDMIFPIDKVSLSEQFSIFRIQEISDNECWRKYQPIVFIDKDPKIYCAENNVNLITESSLEKWKIKQAIPKLTTEIDGKNNPLELGLYDLVDFNKGCYLGQEMMARLNNVSSLKQEIRVCSVNIIEDNFKLTEKKIYESKDKKILTGHITRVFCLKAKEVLALAMIKKNYLNQINSFFNEDLGILKIEKSIGSVFI